MISNTSDMPFGPGSVAERMHDIREAARVVSEGFSRAYMRECIDQHRFPQEIWETLGEYGLLGISIPEDLGGSGGGQVELVALMEALAEAGLVLPMLLLTGFARVPIIRHGTPEQIERFVKPTISGTEKLCFAITEPDAGTNSFAMSSLATREGDGYRLTGRKVFISGAADANRMLVVARTQKVGEVGRRTEGMSLFVVDTDAPGVQLQPLNIDVGWPERQYLVFFDEVRLDADRLIGLPGQGLAGMFEALNSERLLVTAMSVGLGNYALKKAVAYANERKPFGVPIGGYQALQHRLAEAKAELEAARLMMIQAAATFDAGGNAGAHANMAKLLGSRAAVKAVEAALQTHGGYGFDRDYDIITLWPSVRLMEIAPINNEMLLNYIGEHVLGLPKSY
ncbi:acyl-CoA dehydrogenase family protein [Sinimarinibacterium flocculans]|uniref:Alkylation response protein AidB-like acyl-CoA dehydrogenase n=1 Tax=Sinimarinibacterium flocculans TaxID=985250 RepID=A0A318EKE2_9GAMM|nr:acyl-CoA dehydrogenase family protein [Sinimarinibacterium flocculans]PXV71681.1 alkylation response protein AidB-like acyl-CoA dehydrogenase [Sinimarinibacterium flocculans]